MATHLQHRVRYHEVDQQGFLFNGRYLEITDVAMTEFFRDLGWTYRELNDIGVDPSVVHLEADFVSPARFDDVLDIVAECTRMGSSSFTLHTLFENESVRVAEFSITYVNVDATLGKSSPLPAQVLDTLRRTISSEAARSEIEETK